MASARGADGGGRGRSVIVIEPNEAIARLLAEALGQEGWMTATARDAVHGARLARASGASVVLVDLVGGPLALVEAEACALAAGAPALPMSADAATLHAYEDAGRFLLRKPFGLRALFEAVARAAEGAAPDRAPDIDPEDQAPSLPGASSR